MGREQRSLPITELQPHLPMYLIGRWTDRANEQPTSPAAGRSVGTPQDLDPFELKFQLSFKTQLMTSGVFRAGSQSEPATAPERDRFQLWFAYTQQSHWQIANTRDSRPFRETNYAPELILTYDNTDYAGARALKLVNLGFVHQSNGRSNPESRSWNRYYIQGGWEWGGLSLFARKWWAADREDNPDIGRYLGYGDIALRYKSGLGRMMLLARHNLRLNPGREYLQFDWALPALPGIPAGMLHLQATTGFGESLIDYNYRQKTFGLGLTVWNW